MSKGNEPAYPIIGDRDNEIIDEGLTKKQKITTDLLSGMLANPNNNYNLEDKIRDAMTAANIILKNT